jgi:hypothetical protein
MGVRADPHGKVQRRADNLARQHLEPGLRAAQLDAIVCRVVVDQVDDAQLDDLYRIGVDEISYKRGRKSLTIVADHDCGHVVWVGSWPSSGRRTGNRIG